MSKLVDIISQSCIKDTHTEARMIMNDQELLQQALSFMADLNGNKLISGDGVCEVDMRQRAKHLHHRLSQRMYGSGETESED